MIRKLALLLWYDCNNNCVFCYCDDKKGKWSMSTADAKRELEEGYANGCTFVDFNGGEPTLRKDILELISHAKRIGYEQIAMTSNGRMFFYKDFCSRVIEAGLNHVVFSIHGHTPELHDSLTRTAGSYAQVTAGISNMKSLKPDIYICTNTVITKLNYTALPQIAENNIRLGVDGCEFIFVHARGAALANFDKVVPTLTEIKPYIAETLKVGKDKLKHFAFRYIPGCYVPGYMAFVSEAIAKDTMKEHHVGPEYRDMDVERGRALVGRVKSKHCELCQYNPHCEGIFKEYAERRGLSELTPVGNA